MRLLALLISAITLGLTSFASFAADNKTVVMLLWRGVTDAEQGYMDYLKDKMDIEFVLLDANRDKNQLENFVDDIDQYNADLVYTFGTTVTLSLVGTYDQPTLFTQQSNVPAVFSIVTDPVGSKLIATANSDQRRFTGVSHIVPHDAQFKAISQLQNVDTIGILYNPLENNSVLTAQKMRALAKDYNKEIYLYPLGIKNNQPNIDSMGSIVNRMTNDGIDLAYLPPDSYIISNGGQIVETLHSNDIATFSATESPIRKSEALFGIVSRYYNVGQFAAYKSEQILSESIDVTDIPIESMTQYSYIVNINAAKKLNYYPPVSILKISELVGNEQ